MMSAKEPRVLPGWVSACLALMLGVSGVIALPNTASANAPQCCTFDVMCSCGEEQCCPHEELGAMACSQGDEDYCRSTCD